LAAIFAGLEFAGLLNRQRFAAKRSGYASRKFGGLTSVRRWGIRPASGGIDPQNIRGGQAQLFFKSAIAIPQLEGSASAITIPQLFKEMLLRNRNSAIQQSQFFLKSATSSPQLESFNSAIFGTFLAMESGQFIEKKSEVKNLMLLSL
jgi:hypothetical protein